MRVKDILPYINDIIVIYINGELQICIWCENGKCSKDVREYLDCKLIEIRNRNGYLLVEEE